MSERSEALMRIVVGIITGIILGIWKLLIKLIAVIHFFYALFTNKRSKDLGEFAEYWNIQIYKYVRYMTFVTNHRPFPFSELDKELKSEDLKE